MGFLEVLVLAVALLQQQQKISLGALKRIFELDDDGLSDLVFELVQVRRIAIVNDGVLFWQDQHAVGETAAPLPYEPTRAPVAAPAGTETDATSSGQRRHLTVMFCDLVGSTELSTRFDPEDLQDIIRGFQDLCTRIVVEYDGYVAKYMGDGVLIYFGYPQAHENDAERAARTGLAIVEAMPDLGAAYPHAQGIEFTARIGIDTGLVVVGEALGEGSSAELSVVGETPNVAARLQALAAPNAVVIGSVTHDLAAGALECEDLGTHRVKGISDPVQAWRVVGLSDVDSISADAALSGNFLVGRDEEVGLLLRRWEQSKEGHGQAVLISGEPGIGKSTLVETVSARVKHDGYTRIAYRCSPYHTNSVLYPVVEHLKRLAGWQPADSNDEKFAKLEQMLGAFSLPLTESVPLMAGLLSLPIAEDRYPALDLTPQQRKQQTLDTLVALTLEEAERRPVMALWEDLHWADPTTLEFLGMLVEQAPTTSMLVSMTFRPEFAPPWQMRSHMTPITLNRLERPQIEEFVQLLAGRKPLPAEVLQHVVAKTDGVPLYVEELTKMILESDMLREGADSYVLTGPLTDVAIPATLQESLMARLDRLPTLREVAQLGAVLGREFAYEMLHGLAVIEEKVLLEGLRQLVDSELLYQRGRPPRAKYIFKHALVQDAAYHSLLNRTRQGHHKQVAEMLLAHFPEITETEPELVAHHYTEAGNTEPAVDLWLQAGKKAGGRFANVEAIAHLNKGIELLQTLPESEDRNKQELALHTTLGPILMANKGYGAPEVAAVFGRARELCGELGATRELFPVLWGLWLFYTVRAEHQAAAELASQLNDQAATFAETEFVIEAQLAQGATALFRGQLQQAHQHLAAATKLYRPDEHRALALRFGNLDPGVGSAAYDSWSLWLLGYPDQALSVARQTMDWAESVHPYTRARAFYWIGAVRQFVGDWDAVQGHGESANTMAEEHGYALVHAVGSILRGWAMIQQGQAATGASLVRENIEAYRKTGAEFQLPHLRTSLLATVDNDEGMAILTKSLAEVEATGEHYYEAELYRLKGELLLASSDENSVEAEACFNKALKIARKQKAKSLELRAAMSLCRLWQTQGKETDARPLLTKIYNWFTEGFETADLKAARALLDQLPVAA